MFSLVFLAHLSKGDVSLSLYRGRYPLIIRNNMMIFHSKYYVVKITVTLIKLNNSNFVTFIVLYKERFSQLRENYIILLQVYIYTVHKECQSLFTEWICTALTSLYIIIDTLSGTYSNLLWYYLYCQYFTASQPSIVVTQWVLSWVLQSSIQDRCSARGGREITGRLCRKFPTDILKEMTGKGEHSPMTELGGLFVILRTDNIKCRYRNAYTAFRAVQLYTRSEASWSRECNVQQGCLLPEDKTHYNCRCSKTLNHHTPCWEVVNIHECGDVICIMYILIIP